jgi:peptidyl-prolyl cis-trans isomerase A (cyclophilin A)
LDTDPVAKVALDWFTMLKLSTFAALLLFATAGGAQTLPRVLVTTTAGEIELEIDSVRAPNTAKNFLRYVDDGFYNNGRFHRTVTMANQPNNAVKIEVIQAGPDPSRRGQGHAAIPLERTSVTGMSHKDGVVSMARGGADSATSDFFICIGDQLSLDFGGARNADGQGFAAFGRVLRGMDVVKKIQQSPANAQTLMPAVQITSAKRVVR